MKLMLMLMMLMLKLMVNGQPNVAVDVNMSDLCLLMSFHRLTRVGPFKGPVPIQYLFTFILLLWRAIQNFMFTFSFFFFFLMKMERDSAFIHCRY